MTHVLDRPRRSRWRGVRDDARRARLQDPRDPVIQNGRDVQPRATDGVVGRSAEEEDDGDSGSDARESGCGEVPAAEAHLRGGLGGRPLGRRFNRGRLDGGMDGGGALAPEVIGCETGDVGLGRGRGGLAERNKFLGRTEPISWEADDLIRRLRRTARLDFTTFLHPVADLFQLFLAMPSESGASIRLD
jgi:hypothetical protein